MTRQSRRIEIAQPSIGEDEWLALREPIENGWLTQGPKVAQFEEAFALRHSTRHALATTSCTTALHLALAAIGIGPGDEVIVPAFTWIATANAVTYTGAKPVLVDVDHRTYNIDPAALAESLSPRTKAVIPVHLFGLCADMDAIREAVPNEVSILEDAACAAGASYRGMSAGSLGDAGCFSFHPRKSITTGEGGMVTTNNSGIAEEVTRLRNHGASVPEEVRHTGQRPHILPEFNVLGFNYRMTDLQAAIGIVQLAKLDAFIAERAHWAAWYRAQLEMVEWLLPPSEPTDGRHAWQAFVCYVDKSAPLSRNELMDELAAKGISSRPGTHAIHTLGYYSDQYGFKADDFPQALGCHSNALALPLHNEMTEQDYQYVVDALRNVGA